MAAVNINSRKTDKQIKLKMTKKKVKEILNNRHKKAVSAKKETEDRTKETEKNINISLK